MTRIIAGAARGARLKVPGSGTRPTADRVRESLFASLETADALTGARVLDLYAGSGALGLEALSRGATSVDLVERAKPAAAIAKQNAAVVHKAGATGQAHVHPVAVGAFLARDTGPYDLVFTDPPYELGQEAMHADLAALTPLLSTDAVVIVERSSRTPEPLLDGTGLELFREKVYGDTALYWLRPE